MYFCPIQKKNVNPTAWKDTNIHYARIYECMRLHTTKNARVSCGIFANKLVRYVPTEKCIHKCIYKYISHLPSSQQHQQQQQDMPLPANPISVLRPYLPAGSGKPCTHTQAEKHHIQKKRSAAAAQVAIQIINIP